MDDSEEEKRKKKLEKDAKDKFEHEDEYDDKPPRGRLEEDSDDEDFDD